MATTGAEPTETLDVRALSRRSGTSVRTIRYYTTMGLLQPPRRDGRHAVYSQAHLARLELVRMLQDHGFSLSGIGQWLERHDSSGPQDLAVERAVLAAWHQPTIVAADRASLAERAGRALSEADVARLEAARAVERGDDGWELTPAFDVGVRLLDLDLPLDGIAVASDAIRTHMVDLAEELTEIVSARVVRPFRASDPTPEQSEVFGRALSQLRQLTLEAIVLGFRRAANEVVLDGLDPDAPG